LQGKIVHIREALPGDNQELQALQARCPQGENLVVSSVNTPDFFARAKSYESSRTLVVCEYDRIIGSAACALKSVYLNDKPAQVGYLFQAFVAPEYRRSGVASLLLRERESFLAQQNVDLIYTHILEGNRPSMRYVESQGFHLERTMRMSILAVKERMEISQDGVIRSVRVDDLDAVSVLMNETWRGYQLYGPASAESLERFIERTPGFSIENLLVMEAKGVLLSCLGFWDWSQVRQVKVLRLSWRLRLTGWLLVTSRVLPAFPQAGDILNQIMLTTIGYKEPHHLTPLVRYVNNLAFDRGSQQILCVGERDQALLDGFQGFTKIDTTMHVYTKSLDPAIQLGEQPLYVDGIDF
jgi:RimJ/RimL family protein N-acetyltransferase